MPDNNHNNNNHSNNSNNNNNNKPAPRPLLTDLTKNGDSSIESIRGAQNLIRQFGKQVEPALYSLLCDTQSETRATVDKALKAGGPAASEVLVPLLTSQFGIAPVIATMVSAVVLQAIATVGQEKMCRALAEAGAPKTPTTYKPPAHAKPIAGPVAEPRKFEPREPEEEDPKPVISSIRPTTTMVRQPAPPKPVATRPTTRNQPTPIPEPDLVVEEPEAKPKRTRAKAATKAEPKAKAKTKTAAKKKSAVKKKAVTKKKTVK